MKFRISKSDCVFLCSNIRSSKLELLIHAVYFIYAVYYTAYVHIPYDVIRVYDLHRTNVENVFFFLGEKTILKEMQICGLLLVAC